MGTLQTGHTGPRRALMASASRFALSPRSGPICACWRSASPLGARELLRRVLKDGRIVLEPQIDGVYLARAAVLPLRVLAERDHRGIIRDFGEARAA